MSILHSAIQHADCHEPRHITTAVVGDAGKVITPSASVAGTSVLRLLTFAEIAAGDVHDNKLTLVDNSDTTKKAVFECSGITTATTRTLTIPNASGTLVLRDDTATLTNKRITKRVSSVAYAASIDVSVDNFDELRCASLTGNVAVNAPTGTPTEGQRLTVKLTQDGTGGRTITYNAAYVTTGATVTTLSTTETREFEWDATRAKWIQVAYTSGI
jgi:hypothetical protein